MKIVLNALIAKKAGYGGFSVACNFFCSSLKDKEIEWYYLVSQEMADFLRNELKQEDISGRLYVFPNQPDIRSFFRVRHDLNKLLKTIEPDVVYSILAPSYFTFEFPEVMRCANAWSVVGGVNQYAWKLTPFKLRLRYYFKSKITHFLMGRTRFFITQTEVAKKCILRTVRTVPENICVISNVLPGIYQKKSRAKKAHTGYNMAYISSPAAHKDYSLLPKAASILRDKYKLKDFYIHVTVPNTTTEYQGFFNSIKEYGLENCFVNHGYLKQPELAELLPLCDLGLFPSLLETFSATLLEYMYFQLPIVASDLDFNREVAEKAAEYFIPHDAEDMARKIYQVYSDENLRDSLLEQAKTQLAKYSNNTDKYGETVDFLRKVAKMDSK